MLDVKILSQTGICEQFALILINLPAVNAVAMFNHFASDLCGGSPTTPEMTAAAMWAVERFMIRAGKSLTDRNYGFVLPAAEFNNDNFFSDFDCEPLDQTASILVLSQEQELAKASLLALLVSVGSKVITVVARAGTGKSAWVHSVVSHLKANAQISICVAASALAATALPHGRTAHAAFNIPVPCLEDTFLVWSEDVQSKIRRAACIFWDEISMVSSYVVEALNRSLKRLMKTDVDFGGKLIVFLGDFRQLPPIDTTTGNGIRLSISKCSWFQSALRMNFTFNFRAAADSSYAAFLEQVGDGDIEDIEVPSICQMEFVDELITKVYCDGITDYSRNNMILAMTLDQCAAINNECMSRIPGNATTALASDDLRSCKSPDLYPPEYIASLNFGGIPPASLQFKEHARFMIIKNYNPPDVCNGVLCEMLQFSKFNIQVRLLSGPGKGKIVMLPRCRFSVLESKSGLPFSFARWQFPIVCAYAVTIHKSQGQTLNRVGLFIEADAFVHGLIYVALSRVASWTQLSFYSPESKTNIKNKVCKGLLHNARQHL
jgi:ATP-dependent DNA helicase PIF1